MNSQSASTIATNSQFLSFVLATATTNDYLSDIFMEDFTADQSDVQIAAIHTSFQVITKFYHYRFTCLKLSNRESKGNSNYMVRFVEYSSMWSCIIWLKGTIFSKSGFKTIRIRTHWNKPCSRCFSSLNFLGIHHYRCYWTKSDRKCTMFILIDGDNFYQ